MRKKIINLNNTDDVSNFPFIIMIAALSVFGLSYFDKSIPWWLPIPPFVIAAFFYLKRQKDKRLIKTLEKQNWDGQIAEFKDTLRRFHLNF